MKRKTFIKLSASMTAAPLLSTIEGWAQKEKLKNWAGNIEYSTDQVSYPSSVNEVQELVKKTNRLKPLGTRHCFNTIADSKDHLLSLQELNRVVSLDTSAKTVTVEGGIRYGTLSPYLDSRGFALHNLASLPHISVAGSITTATHGSGVTNKNLSSAVQALEIVTANGNVVSVSREKDGDNFLGSVVGLGALGVITKVTLSIQPTFQVKQYVYEGLPLAELKINFEKIMSAGYSVSLFTDWQTENINEIWVKSREGADSFQPDSHFFEARAATKNVHPIIELSAENCTEQMGIAGSWYNRLPHFKMGFTPSSGKELQTEYFVPFHHGVEAILTIQRLGKQISPHLFISEIRTIDSDDLWMSPCYKQLSVAIHFTWKQDWNSVQKLLPIIEKELSPFIPRPHWGKLFTLAPTVLASRYEKLSDFKKLVNHYDPQGKFRNEFLDKLIFVG
jgi:xylitol oxidase